MYLDWNKSMCLEQGQGANNYSKRYKKVRVLEKGAGEKSLHNQQLKDNL